MIALLAANGPLSCTPTRKKIDSVLRGLDDDRLTVVGIYLWESKAQADAFYSPEWTAGVMSHWGSMPANPEWQINRQGQAFWTVAGISRHGGVPLSRLRLIERQIRPAARAAGALARPVAGVGCIEAAPLRVPPQAAGQGPGGDRGTGGPAAA